MQIWWSLILQSIKFCRKRCLILVKKKKCVLTNGLYCTVTNLLIWCLQLGVKGISSNSSHVFPLISPGTHLEAGQSWLNLQGKAIDPCNKLNNQKHHDLNPWLQDFKSRALTTWLGQLIWYRGGGEYEFLVSLILAFWHLMTIKKN